MCGFTALECLELWKMCNGKLLASNWYLYWHECPYIWQISVDGYLSNIQAALISVKPLNLIRFRYFKRLCGLQIGSLGILKGQNHSFPEAECKETPKRYTGNQHSHVIGRVILGINLHQIQTHLTAMNLVFWVRFWHFKSLKRLFQ